MTIFFNIYNNQMIKLMMLVQFLNKISSLQEGLVIELHNGVFENMKDIMNDLVENKINSLKIKKYEDLINN